MGSFKRKGLPLRCIRARSRRDQALNSDAGKRFTLIAVCDFGEEIKRNPAISAISWFLILWKWCFQLPEMRYAGKTMRELWEEEQRAEEEASKLWVHGLWFICWSRESGAA
jgi:hypothetical protein